MNRFLQTLGVTSPLLTLCDDYIFKRWNTADHQFLSATLRLIFFQRNWEQLSCKRIGWGRLCLLILVLFCFASKDSHASRDQEILSCLPEELKTWKDGVDRRISEQSVTFTYQSSSKSLLDEEDLKRMISRASEAWSDCGIRVELKEQNSSEANRRNGEITIKWADRSMEGVAHANISSRELLLNPEVFQLLKKKGGFPLLKSSLQMTLSHEMGHFLGMMAHSKRCVDVMSYYTSPSGESGERCIIRDPSEFRKFTEYRSELPTACDIDRCRKLNRE